MNNILSIEDFLNEATNSKLSKDYAALSPSHDDLSKLPGFAALKRIGIPKWITGEKAYKNGTRQLELSANILGMDHIDTYEIYPIGYVSSKGKSIVRDLDFTKPLAWDDALYFIGGKFLSNRLLLNMPKVMSGLLKGNLSELNKVFKQIEVSRLGLDEKEITLSKATILIAMNPDYLYNIDPKFFQDTKELLIKIHNENPLEFTELLRSLPDGKMKKELESELGTDSLTKLSKGSHILKRLDNINNFIPSKNPAETTV